MDLGLVAQKGNDRAAALAGTVVEALDGDGVTVRVDEATATALEIAGEPAGELADCPLVLSVGGDGTFLYTAHHVGSTPILGVNLGEVGFLNVVSPDEAVDAVREEVAHIREHGQPRFREVPRVVARGDGWSLPPGLNEVGVLGEQRGRGQGLEVAVAVDGATFVEGHADGVLVATPTGSTAYNLAEGGPLVHPAVAALVVTAMSPASPAPPLVIDRDSAVRLQVTGAERAIVASDGAERRSVETPAEVTVAVHREPGRIAGPPSEFFQALEKLEPADGHAGRPAAPEG